MSGAADSAIPPGDPLALFDQWFAEAAAAEPNDPNAMALATATPAGRPSVRTVLLKEHGAGAFTFYTNARSRKGEEIAANPHAALLFHWKSLRRQIRIEGALTPVDAARADAYFASRPRLSQIGSAASDQSRPLADRAEYLRRVEEFEARFPEGTAVPRPPHWTGFSVEAERIEFWHDQPGRLHDRRLFTRGADGAWTSTLLYP